MITDVKQSDFQYGQGVDVLGSFDFKLSDNQDINLDVQHYVSKVRNDKWLFYGVDYAGLKNPDLIAVKGGAYSDIVPSTTRSMVNLQYNLRNILGGQNLMVQVLGERKKLISGLHLQREFLQLRRLLFRAFCLHCELTQMFMD